MDYRRAVLDLLRSLPLPIDLDLRVQGRRPTAASSDFLTNREQGTWAEEVVIRAINDHAGGLRAVRYGDTDATAPGDPDFKNHFSDYQEELNTIGKRPDILIFRSDVPGIEDPVTQPEIVRRATAALEIRSSSFLSERYSSFMSSRVRAAEARCLDVQREILAEPNCSLLAEKNPVLYDLVRNASIPTFRELSFRQPSWRSTPALRRLTELLKTLKSEIAILHRRDYLSITPKLEDLCLVNRWIQRFGVRHYYLQVFFDKAYLISFLDILRTISKPEGDGATFRIEEDVKNQGKTTIKINIAAGTEVVGRMQMPLHHSVMRTLERGRLLFHVRFSGGTAYLDRDAFLKALGEPPQ